jgi:hypothetical protein
MVDGGRVVVRLVIDFGWSKFDLLHKKLSKILL